MPPQISLLPWPALTHTVFPTALRQNSLSLALQHPFIFFASGLSGACVNLTSFLLVSHKPHAIRPTPYAPRHTPHATRHTPHATRHKPRATSHEAQAL